MGDGSQSMGGHRDEQEVSEFHVQNLCIYCFNYVHKIHVCNIMDPGDPQLCNIIDMKIPTA